METHHKFYIKTYKNGVIVREVFHAAHGRPYNMDFNKDKGYTRAQAAYLIGVWNNQARRYNETEPRVDAGVYSLLWEKENEVVNALLPALRQYRGNMTDDFIAGYDKEEAEKVVGGLLAQIKHLNSRLAAIKVALEGLK